MYRRHWLRDILISSRARGYLGARRAAGFISVSCLPLFADILLRAARLFLFAWQSHDVIALPFCLRRRDASLTLPIPLGCFHARLSARYAE